MRDNLAFGLRMRGADTAFIAERVERAAETLGLEDVLDRKPAQLSGGQRQRVALGRAIVREPKAFLFDEPLSNLDAKLRVHTRAELARMHKRLGATMIYVTHDQEEAMTLGDRVAILHDGVLQQVATPAQVYMRPANAFVGGFIGSPTMNFFLGRLEADDGGRRFVSPALNLELAAGPGAPAETGAMQLGVRPRDIAVAEPGQSDVVARVDVVELLGSEELVHLSLPSADDQVVRAIFPEETPVREDETIGLRFRRDRLHFFAADDGRRLG